MLERPPVTVLLPVYNTRRYFLAALRSVLAQDFADFELLVVNDGSTDGSEKLVGMVDDPRVRVIHQPHRGIVAALNLGLAEARGELIARMDADDIALPQRLGRQVHYMRSHPRVVLLGTRFVYINARGRLLFNPDWPCEDEPIRQALPVYNCFTHPTVMFRREAALAAGGYRKELQYQEDYDLWLRMIDLGEAAQLPDVLLYYRLSSASLSFRNRRQQSTVLDGMVKELYRQRQSEGKDVLQRGGEVETLRHTLQQQTTRWAQRQRWSRQLVRWGEGCLAAGRRLPAMRLAMESIWNDPLTRWNWSLLGRCVFPSWRGVLGQERKRKTALREPAADTTAQPEVQAQEAMTVESAS